MAFRKPQHPRIDRWEHRQSWAARMVGLGLLLVLAGVALVLADWTLPPQHLPWKPLKLSEPVGVATAGKIQSAAPSDCRAALRQGGIVFTDVPDRAEGDFCLIQDAVTLTGGVAALHPAAAIMMCREALAFATWERQTVQPQASLLLGSPVVSMEQFGAYECRRRYSRVDQPVSEHALADALDVGVFILADGRRVSVADDWADPGSKGVFLHAVRDGACGIFSTVLSPDYNVEHRNHLHLDMAPLAVGRGRFCH